jgi:hypothetical protein
MPKRYAEYDDDDNLDENGLLKDGRSVRVPMMMRDHDAGLTELQRSVRDHFAPVTLVDSFGNSGLALHKPGARYLIAGAGTGDHARLVTADAIRADAYADSVRAACDAWRGPNASDREVARVHNTGDAVRDAYLDQKHDLENSWHRGSGKRSHDSAPAGPVYDAVEGQRVKDAAYAEMVNELVTAWQRKP